jgi:hypothetical protein
MNKYKLTFTVEVKGQDDPDARKQAKGILEAIDKVVPDIEMKLQQVYMNKAPRGVRLG